MVFGMLQSFTPARYEKSGGEASYCAPDLVYLTAGGFYSRNPKPRVVRPPIGSELRQQTLILMRVRLRNWIAFLHG